MYLLALLINIACAAAAFFCLHIERKSRKWYQDRAMLVLAGVFFGLSLAALVWFMRCVFSA